jgi:hypothetical protein
MGREEGAGMIMTLDPLVHDLIWIKGMTQTRDDCGFAFEWKLFTVVVKI